MYFVVARDSVDDQNVCKLKKFKNFQVKKFYLVFWTSVKNPLVERLGELGGLLAAAAASAASSSDLPLLSAFLSVI